MPFQAAPEVPSIWRGMAKSERAAQIGERIRERRKQLDLTQEDLARKTQSKAITGNVVSRWENGRNRPSADNLTEIAEALGVDDSYLLFGQSAPHGVPAPANDKLLEHLAGIEARLGELVAAVSLAKAPDLGEMVASTLKALGVEAPPRTSGAAPKRASAASKPPRRRRANG